MNAIGPERAASSWRRSIKTSDATLRRCSRLPRSARNFGIRFAPRRKLPISESAFMLLIKIVAAGAVVILATAPPLIAQEISSDHPTSEVASAVRSQSLRRSIAREAGRLAEIRVPAASARSQSQPQRSWIGRHPVATGALIGAGAGAVWAEVFCRGKCEGDPRLYMALFGGIGAGIGAGVGAAVAAIRR